MEYIAKIIKGERSKNKQFRWYTFLDIKTGKEDWFISNYRVGYTPNLVGKLKLIWDKSGNYKIFQHFEQDIINLTEEEEEILFYSQEKPNKIPKEYPKIWLGEKRLNLWLDK